ncbi:ABC transporter permease [candidate division KSB1 bacterium]|nr:ABC transporter permease [candidate division KSB1 bacterium]
MKSLRPILFFVRKEFIQFRRDPQMKRIVFVMPTIQLLVLAYALTTDLRNVRLAVLDQDCTQESRELASAFLTSDLFEQRAVVKSSDELEVLLSSGAADIGINIPVNYARDLLTARHATIGIVVDGQNSSSAGRAVGYAEGILRQESLRKLVEIRDSSPRLANGLRRIEPLTRFFYNPELVSRYYMIPGIVALLLTVISAMLTGMAIVREQEIGTLEQLLVSPLRPGQMIAGKLIPFTILAYLELAIAATVAVWWFDLPFVGSVSLLAFCSLCYLLVTLGGGLLASTVSHTQQQAMFTVWFFLVFGILTSGFFYPIENMPKWIQYLTYANPMRYFMAILRAIFLKGAQFSDVLPNLLPLAALGVITFSTAILRFRRRLA